MIFWQNIVVAPIAIVAIMIGLPVEPMRLQVFGDTDYPAMIFCILGVGALTAALGEGQTLDWFDSGVIIGLFVIAGVSLAAFVINELTCDRPLIDVRLFQQINFTLGLIVLLAFNFTLLGAYYILPQFAAVVKGWRELQIGEILIWLALPQIVLTPLSALAGGTSVAVRWIVMLTDRLGVSDELRSLPISSGDIAPAVCHGDTIWPRPLKRACGMSLGGTT